MATKPRRPAGTGSVYQDHVKDCPRTSACGCRWVASIDAGWSRTGARRRPRRIAHTEREARALMQKMLRENVEVTEVTASTTVKTYCEQWVKIDATRSRPKTHATNASCVRRWIIPTIGRRRLDQLTPAHIRSVSAAIIAAKLAPATAQRAHVLLHKILKDATVEGHKVPERVLLVEAPSRGESDRDAIPTKDARAILEAAGARLDETRWAVAFLGVRPAECRGLTWACVDLERGELDISWQLQPLPYNVTNDPASGFKVPIGFTARHLVDAYHLVRPKTNKGKRVIPLDPYMVQALRQWRLNGPQSPHDLVWPEPDGRPRNDVNDRDAWKAICKEAKVKPYDLYEARHTIASLLLDADQPREVIAAIMGHSKLLDSYLHLTDRRTRDALEGSTGLLR